jgi:hypothetical protein
LRARYEGASEDAPDSEAHATVCEPPPKSAVPSPR